MKMIKRVISIVLAAIVMMIIYSTSVKAATTLKVTADTLNLREKASTSSNVLVLISNGEKCELIEEEGDWYKVKYKTYTGYVAKEYVKKEVSINQEDNKDDISDNNDVQVIAKISKKTSLKLLPLIYSSELDTLDKNQEILILSELNGWAYIQTDTLTGWIRSDNISGRESVSDNKVIEDKKEETAETVEKTEEEKEEKENKEDTTTSEKYEEKTMYINDSYVNLRKEPNTSSEILMVVGLNTKLTVIGESGEWYKLRTSEGEAYVSKSLVSSKETTTSRGSVKKVISNSSDNVSKTEEPKTSKEDTTTSVNTKQETATSTSTKGQEIVSYAKKFLGVPYVYGGASKSGFDCSGFTMYVYKKFGISMGHGAQMQSRLGKAVKADKTSAKSLKENLQLGDLVFFLDYETMDEIGHCGIYIGDGKFIHASSGSGYCVKISGLLPGESYNARYCAARRLI